MITIKHFTASWCQPCKQLIPIMQKIAKEYPMINYQRVDIDNNPDVAQQYGVRAVPTVLFEKHGTIVQQVVGLQPMEYYEQIINNL